MDIDRKAPEAILKDLGLRLRAARLAANLTQRELAEAARVSPKTVANAEDGQNISLETLLLLMRGVGRLADVERLLADRGPSPVELAKRSGRQRQRASGRRDDDQGNDGEWQW